MKIEILVSDDKRSYSISLDGGDPEPMDNFILLTKEGERTRNLVFGNVEMVGRLLYGLYVNCWKFEEQAMRNILETVAEDIRDVKEQRETVTGDAMRWLM